MPKQLLIKTFMINNILIQGLFATTIIMFVYQDVRWEAVFAQETTIVIHTFVIKINVKPFLMFQDGPWQ